MITVFRRLRKQFLGENKFTRYLVYALGEIILVVIGILIALQINTWKEENTLRKKENDYLIDIHSFLLQDKKNVEDLNEFYIEKQGVYDTLLTFFDQKFSEESIMLTYLPYLRSTPAYLLFDINSTAFENMMSANDISIISNKELRYQLSYYYKQDPLVGIQDRLQKATRAFRDYYSERFASKESMDGFLRINSLAPTRAELGDIRAQPEFYRLFFDATISVGNELAYLRRQKGYIDDLITVIEKEINQE